MSAQGTYRFYSVSHQTSLLVNGEPLGRERVKKHFNTKSEKLGMIAVYHWIKHDCTVPSSILNNDNDNYYFLYQIISAK